MGEQAWLVLEDGSYFAGTSFGAPPPSVDELQLTGYSGLGEVIFNTAMVGYHEVLTDPSYTGQIVAMTYPHIGNYGISDEWNESGPLADIDGRPIKVAGFVLRNIYTGPVPQGRHSLHSFLSDNKIPGITDLDTRRLTLKLRKHGTINGLIMSSQALELSADELKISVSHIGKFPSMEGRNLISDVGTQKVLPPHIGENVAADCIDIAVYDCGTKANIIRELLQRGCSVTIYPSTTHFSQILNAGHQAVMFSNGPGDPGTLTKQIQTVKSLIGQIPVFGICLGHQLIAQAIGADIFKMRFGHHGINHPVRDERTGRVFVTSQNHGFAVDINTLSNSTEVWFVNANDQTVEGIRNDELGVMSVQFHPESAPGPYDSHWIFDEFLRAIPVR